MKNYQITVEPAENGYVVKLSENMMVPSYGNNLNGGYPRQLTWNNPNGGYPRQLTWIASDEAGLSDIINRETTARAK